MTFDKTIEKVAFPAVLATFLGIPLAVWLYDTLSVSLRYSADTKVFTLYWSGDKGITRQRITGWNYWQPGFDLVKEGDLKVRQGERVVFRLISGDVHHGFALPAFGITNALIMPGDLTEVAFVADKVGSFKFFCTIMCGHEPIHEKMAADLTVLPRDASQVEADLSRPVATASVPPSGQSHGTSAHH